MVRLWFPATGNLFFFVCCPRSPSLEFYIQHCAMAYLWERNHIIPRLLYPQRRQRLSLFVLFFQKRDKGWRISMATHCGNWSDTQSSPCQTRPLIAELVTNRLLSTSPVSRLLLSLLLFIQLDGISRKLVAAEGVYIFFIMRSQSVDCPSPEYTTLWESDFCLLEPVAMPHGSYVV